MLLYGLREGWVISFRRSIIFMEKAHGACNCIWADMTFGKLKKERCTVSLLLLLFISIAAMPAFAMDGKPSPWRDPQALVGYADELMEKGEFERAAIEYKRFLLLYPEHTDALEVELRLGLAYRKANDWRRAVETFYVLAALNEKEKRLSARAMFHLAETYAMEGLHADALREYTAFLKRYPEDPLAPEARYGAGWAMMALGDGEGASAQFSFLDRSSALFPKAQELARSSLELADIRRPSPEVAGALSAILPGAGHAYAGRLQNALISFLINGALIAGAVALFARGNDGGGLLISIFETGWYVGGIRSAAQNAREAYREALEEHLQQLAHKYDFPIHLKPEENRITIEFFHIPLDGILRGGSP
jgi:tetratricopeptide (TPR) repeat protein